MPSQVFAHALWKPGSSLPPRSTDDLANLKFKPCGGNNPTPLLRGIKPKIYKTNESIAVEWIETIDHEGYFYIRLLDVNNQPINQFKLDNPTTFEMLDTNDSILFGTKLTRSKMIKMPATECTKCSMQLLQEMWRGTPPARDVNFDLVNYLPAVGTFYFSCSDIRLEASSSIIPGKISNLTRTNNTNDAVLNWINPSQLSNNINDVGYSNVAYRVLIISDTSLITVSPTGGAIYTTDPTGNNKIGTATVVYDGNLETATITGLTDTTNQHFKLFT